MQTFHADVFFPAQILRLVPRGIIGLIFTEHAQRAARNDRYGQFELPFCLDMREARLIEASFGTNGKLVKFVVRIKHTINHDMVLVVAKDRGNYILKTVWLNSASDKHNTLDASKYVRG